MPLLGTIGESSARAYTLYGNRKIIELTISSPANNYDVYTNRGPTYAPGASDIVVTVNPGVTVGSTSTGTYAMLVPSAFSPDDTVTIVNNGLIQGMGGAGGRGSLPAPAVAGAGGGNAIYVNRPTTITNNSTVAAGGGGGGGGGHSRTGTIGSPTGNNGGGGGGGGAGTNGGAGGAGGAGSGIGSSGNPGSAGTSPAGGAGGPGGFTAGQNPGGPGGAGGGRGAAGTAGTPGSPSGNAGAGGGAAGNYIVGNPFVTWPATGTRQGGVA